MGGSSSRRARRLAAKGKGKKSTGLVQVGNQVGEALGMLRKIEGLEGSVKMLEGIEAEITKANTLLEAMVGDLQALNTEVEAQREITLRLLAEVLTTDDTDGGEILKRLRAAEEHIRATVLMKPETESTDEDG
jgi:hypothetical protein